MLNVEYTLSNGWKCVFKYESGKATVVLNGITLCHSVKNKELIKKVLYSVYRRIDFVSYIESDGAVDICIKKNHWLKPPFTSGVEFRTRFKKNTDSEKIIIDILNFLTENNAIYRKKRKYY